MAQRYTIVIAHEEDWFVAHCLELDVVSQGRSIEEAQANIREAVELYHESFPDDARSGSKEVILYQLEVA